VRSSPWEQPTSSIRSKPALKPEETALKDDNFRLRQLYQNVDLYSGIIDNGIPRSMLAEFAVFLIRRDSNMFTNKLASWAIAGG
jgi:citrate synthase